MERQDHDMWVCMGSRDYSNGESQRWEESTCGSDFGLDTYEENRMWSDGSDGSDGGDKSDNMEE